MKKVFLAMLCIAVTFVSCQKDEVQDPENQSIEQQFRNDTNFVGKSAAASLETVARDTESLNCVDCDVTMTYFSASGGTAQVDVVDSNNNSVFSGVVTTGTTYTFQINTCESYDITTQSLTGGYGNVEIEDDATSYIIPATEGNPVTYIDYSFKCIDETAANECTIEVCIDVFSGTTNGTYLGIFVNGSLNQQLGPLQDGDCVTLTINENDTLEIRQITPGAPSNFGFFLRISTQTHSLSYPMKGFFSSTGIIPSRFLQCLE